MPRTWAEPADLIGQVFDQRYRLEAILGQGGMGAVYDARQVQLEKRVAVKVLHPRLATEERHRKRFLREARAATRIPSMHVVEILDFGDEPMPYFVMEFLDGEDLGALIKGEGPLPWARARALLVPVLHALSAAHSVGIVHRDVKPSNIFVNRQRDGSLGVKVVDFGIAKVEESSPETQGITETGEVIGTVAYMAPEQAMGGRIDPRTDVYATGCVLFEMLTGAPPFREANRYKLLDAHVRVPPPDLCSVEPTVPAAVGKLVARALAKDPELRFGSMQELLAAVETAPSTLDGPAPPAVLEPVAPTPLAAAPAPALTPAADVAQSIATHPGDVLATEPSFGEQTGVARRRRTGLIAALVAVPVAVALAIGVGALLVGETDDDDVPASVPAAVVAKPAPSPRVAREPVAEQLPEVGAPELELAADVPPDVGTAEPTAPSPSSADELEAPEPRKSKRVRTPTRADGRKGASKPATDATVIGGLRKRIRSKCGTLAPGSTLQIKAPILSSGKVPAPVVQKGSAAAQTCALGVVRGAAFPSGSFRTKSFSVQL